MFLKKYFQEFFEKGVILGVHFDFRGCNHGFRGVHYFTCSGKLKLDTKMWDVVH